MFLMFPMFPARLRLSNLPVVAGLLLLIAGPPAEGLAGSIPPDLKRGIEALQSELIDDQITGSNVVIVVKDGQTLCRSIVNSGRPGDRDITDRTLFPIWSMSKPTSWLL